MQMEMYNVPGQEYVDAYMFQGNGLNGFSGQYAPQDFDHFGTMYREGPPPEFVVDQSMYYTPPANFGYVTGLESPGDWDDRQMVLGMDALDVHYAGAESENSPFVYYNPNVAYAQSPYNPYNPYIPGAVFGADGSYLGPQQYYNVPSYENQSSPQMYFPMNVQSRSDINAHNTSHSFVDPISSNSYRVDGPNLKNNLSSASPAFSMTPWLSAPNQTNSYRRTSVGNNAVAGSSMRPMAKGSATSSGLFFHPGSTPNIHNRSAQGVENVPHGKSLSVRTQSKAALSNGNAFSNFRPSSHALSAADKVQSKFTLGKVHNDSKMPVDKLREQNQIPKVDISGNKLIVRAYTSRAGNADSQGNITINLDQYDNDFSIDYPNAKFFIIKSYSEDDVHKCIKYNVWSSTPNGNKKLNSTYDAVQRIAATSGSCPVFLFFSVNASGQFCGVAEMIGSVDFHKDMDFWQQDKWSGSFPVKWQIVKDVPNFNFRHIILENNDNKPVTNSRDTQEVPYSKGVEMLKIFRSYISKTSLLDDFLYYENRQRILQEEKTRLLLKNFNNPFFVPVQQDPPRKQNPVPEKHNDSSSSSILDKSITAASTDAVKANDNVDNRADDASSATKEKAVVAAAPNGEEEETNIEEALKISSLTIASSTHSESTGPSQDDDATSGGGSGVVSGSAVNGVLTVGSIPVKVNGFAEEPTGVFTVGTIQLYPRPPSQDIVVGGGSVKPAARKGLI